MNKIIRAIVAIVALSSVYACNTPRNVAYFQDASAGAEINVAKEMSVRVKPDDKLSIVVSARDMELASMFNLVQVQNRMGQTSVKGGSSNTGEGRTSLYTVNSLGDISFPILGTLHVGGMKREEVASYIARRLIEENYLRDPIVTVDFANTGFSILGEVSAPGRYDFSRDRLSILEAIAMAGDLKPNGQRENVKVIRESASGAQEVYAINLTDANSVMQSPAYWLQQNDVIYVEPNDKAKRETTPNGNSPYTPAFWISVGSFAVTISTMIITLAK